MIKETIGFAIIWSHLGELFFIRGASNITRILPPPTTKIDAFIRLSKAVKVQPVIAP
ncbi:MAG TPA: hypothetical protein PLT82_03010 [Candidatus Hydrogenedens sp.]|nr:hypothetical protein [Candidatus Hydrogenedens sp.]HOL19099.1 hypothetical protein [Candidatus Hydrogenedens sp.]HPP58083.1 hypothetical protein [Candidatus Hydrogenedens sp.]